MNIHVASVSFLGTRFVNVGTQDPLKRREDLLIQSVARNEFAAASVFSYLTDHWIMKDLPIGIAKNVRSLIKEELMREIVRVFKGTAPIKENDLVKISESLDLTHIKPTHSTTLHLVRQISKLSFEQKEKLKDAAHQSRYFKKALTQALEIDAAICKVDTFEEATSLKNLLFLETGTEVSDFAFVVSLYSLGYKDWCRKFNELKIIVSPQDFHVKSHITLVLAALNNEQETIDQSLKGMRLKGSIIPAIKEVHNKQETSHFIESMQDEKHLHFMLHLLLAQNRGKQACTIAKKLKEISQEVLLLFLKNGWVQEAVQLIKQRSLISLIPVIYQSFLKAGYFSETIFLCNLHFRKGKEPSRSYFLDEVGAYFLKKGYLLEALQISEYFQSSFKSVFCKKLIEKKCFFEAASLADSLPERLRHVVYKQLLELKYKPLS